MITTDIIEVQKDSTYTFSIFRESQNISIIPTTALITITDSTGSELLASTAMTIDATTGLCTYVWDSTGNDTGCNYIVKFNIDSDNTITRLFDIYLYPFTNQITDDDLILEYDDLKTGVWEASGQAQSGSTTTLVDKSRYENDNHWNGGNIEVFINDNSYIREITSFVNATHTITFSPSLDIGVNEHKYIIRKSYQNNINYAGNKVCLDLKRIDKRASLVLDGNAIKYLIINKFFEDYFFKRIKSSDDEYSIKYELYRSKYQNELKGLNIVYDANGDGIVDDGEDNTHIGQVKWYR